MNRRALFILTFIFAACYTASSQSINDVPMFAIDLEYVRIVGTSEPFSNKETIRIDFGQEAKWLRAKNRTGQVAKWLTAKDTQVKDKNDEPITFTSIIDALNFMSKYGYDFVDAYTIADSSQHVHYYLLKKRKE